MRLLFDEDLSEHLVEIVAEFFPDCEHVRRLGMASADDEVIWKYAKERNMMLCSKDSDFYHRSMLFGHPPKVLWIRLGNCTTSQIASALRAQQKRISDFEHDNAASFLILG